MSTTPTVYVICDKNCKFEGMTKEQIYTAIMQAVNEGTIGDIDTGFITTIKTINGTPLKFFVGEQAEYEELTEEDKENLFALITNDTTGEGILTAIEQIRADQLELREGLESGSIIPKKATALKLGYESTETQTSKIEISETGIYVVELLNDDNIYTTAIIIVSDLTATAYSNVVYNGDYTNYVKYEPQGTDETGAQYGYLTSKTTHEATASLCYVTKITRIGG